LKPETLLKAIQRGMEIEDNNVIFKSQKIKASGYNFYATKDLEKFHFSRKNIGAGGFGIVFKTVELKNREERALKIPKDKHAIDNLYKTREILKELNDPNRNPPPPHDGIPSTPSEITEISINGIKSAFFDMELQSSDVYTKGSFMPNFQKLSVSERLNLCNQLLSGVVYMHAFEIKHGDIKPQNCLVRNDENGIPVKLVLSDFDGASKKQTTASTENYRPSDYESSQPEETCD
jgi:serine/threonine protein kinase